MDKHPEKCPPSDYPEHTVLEIPLKRNSPKTVIFKMADRWSCKSTSDFPVKDKDIVFYRSKTTGEIFVGTYSLLHCLNRGNMKKKYKSCVVPSCLGDDCPARFVIPWEQIPDFFEDMLEGSKWEKNIGKMLGHMCRFLENKTTEKDRFILLSSSSSEERESKFNFQLQGVPVPDPTTNMDEQRMRRIVREELQTFRTTLQQDIRLFMSQEARVVALSDVQNDPEFPGLKKRKMEEVLDEIKKQIHEELLPHHPAIREQVRKALVERFEKDETSGARHEALLKRLKQNVDLLNRGTATTPSTPVTTPETIQEEINAHDWTVIVD